MAVLTSEDKKKIFLEYGGSESNTGSMEAQVAQITHRINHMSEHLKSNKKDHGTRMSLMRLVGRRRRYLRYIAKKDINNYRSLVERLGLRK